MYRIFMVISMLVIVNFGMAQADSVVKRSARDLAVRMADSLRLNAEERSNIEAANLTIMMQKRAARQANGGDRMKTAKALQAAENMRDSLYKAILPSVKYERYLSRKIKLVNTQ